MAAIVVKLSDPGLHAILQGPEIGAILDTLAEKAKGIAEGLAAEHVRTGTYERSFEIREGEAHVGRSGLRQTRDLVNVDPKAVYVERGTGNQRILGRTLEALR